MVYSVNFLLSILAFLLCCLTGAIQGNTVLKKVKTLQEIIDGLYVLKNEISIKLSLLPQAISSATSPNTQRFFAAFLLSLKNGVGCQKAWQQNDSLLCIDEQSKQLLQSLAAVLGKTDAANQAEYIQKTIKQLEANLVILQAKCKGSAKLYTYIGAIAGITIVIINI